MSPTLFARTRGPLPLAVALLACLFAVSPHALARQTYTHRSRHYEIVTDLPRHAIRDIGDHMDAVAEAYQRRLASFNVRNAMRNRLYVFQSRDDYVDFMADLDVAAHNTGGVFFVRQGQAGLATWAEGRPRSRMYHVLQHEGFHQFAFARIGAHLPPWANEGIAEYFGHALTVRGGLRTGLAPAARLAQIKAAVRAGLHFPFDEIVRMSSSQWGDVVRTGGPRASLMYSQAWSMAHFLIHAEDSRYAPAFESYLRAVSTGKNADQALEEAFGTTELAAFERAWRAYVLEMEPDPISTAVERLEFLGEGLSHLHDAGIEVESVDELERRLRARRFTLDVYEHGIRREFTADDPTLFEPPPTGTGRASAISIKPSRFSTHPSRRDLPPMIDVTGLGPHIRLHWRRNEDGELVSEVSIR